MKSRLRDPVHFFNAEGVAVLTLKHLMLQNTALEKEVERLKRLLRAQIQRNQAFDQAIDDSEKN